jgi:flagellar protein FlbD
MIEATKLGGGRVYVNADHIEAIESQPETVLVLQNGKHIIVRESVEEIVARVVEYQRLVRSGPSSARTDLRNTAREQGED